VTVHKRSRIGGTALAATAALLLAACSSSGGGSAPGTGPASASGGASAGSGTAAGALPSLKGKHLTVLAEWSGAEQTDFQSVLSSFEKQTGASVSYQSGGSNTGTVLQTKIAGGAPPDVALLPEPGLITTLAQRGAIKPLSPAIQQEVAADYGPGWESMGTVGGKLYSVVYKASNKTTFWYNTAEFSQAGITPPTNWTQFLADCQTLSDAGITPVSVGGSDGWTLADWFQNIYLSEAGPALYNKLAHHQIPWTDPSVIRALTTFGQLLGNQKYIAGGDAGALQTSFNNSVTQTFTSPPKAAMVFEGDFSATQITSTTTAKVGTAAKFFPFPGPASGGSSSFVQVAGDMATALNTDPATMELVQYLASPAADAIWAHEGGYLTPNKQVPLSDYPDATTQQEAQMLISAGTNVDFSLDDLSPAAFGGTVGAGYWKDMQDFLKDPANVQGTARQLEADAAKVTWS
jgi:alpha-glucoside transport system substrate-binding protein